MAPFIEDMRRLLDLGCADAARATCKGIVLGLYSLRRAENGSVLEWAPDFALETAAFVVSEVARATSPPAGESPMRITDEAVEWAEALERASRRS